MPPWLDACRDILEPDAVVADPASLLVYESDAFTLIRAAPEAVLYPRNTQQTAAIVRVLARHGVPIVPRGAGTSLAGGTIAVGGGACICTSRMRDILCVDPRGRWAHVQAGVVNLHLSRALAGSGLHFAPDPSSQMVSTLGGNVATNAGGPHTLKYGVTTNHVLAVTLVLADGRVAELGLPPPQDLHQVAAARNRSASGVDAPAPEHDARAVVEDVCGYDLRALAVGSEGTLGVITEAVVRLTRTPQAVWTALAVFDSVDDAANVISDIIAAGIVPAALEMIDRLTLQCVEAAFQFGFPPDAGAVLIIELDGLAAGLPPLAARVTELCRGRSCRALRAAETDERRAELWKCRKRAFGAYGRLGKACCTQDGVVPRTRVPDIVRFIEQVARRHELMIATMMHAGDGNIHPVLLYDERDPEQVRRVLDASHEILSECVRLGGTVTGEHGIGIEKVRHLREMFNDADLAAQNAVRACFDPDRRCNPEKVFASGVACLERMLPAGGIAP